MDLVDEIDLETFNARDGEEEERQFRSRADREEILGRHVRATTMTEEDEDDFPPHIMVHGSQDHERFVREHRRYLDQNPDLPTAGRRYLKRLMRAHQVASKESRRLRLREEGEFDA